MKLKKIALYYREMSQYEDSYPEEIQESEKYEDFETFLSTLEEKYGFKLSNCQWMVSEELHIARYENGEEVQTEDI